MKIKDALQLTEKQFDGEEFLKRQGSYQYDSEWDNNLFWDNERISKEVKNRKINSLIAKNDDISRSPIIIKMLKKIKPLPKDFSLIDLGCGMAGVVKEIKKKFPHSDLYGVDVFTSWGVCPDDDIFKFYELDFMKLLKLDFQCDVALMLNLYHSPHTFQVSGVENNDINNDKLKVFMKNLEKGISSKFDYFITLLNYKQYESFKNGVSHYSKIPIKIIYEEPFPIGDCSVSQWVVVEFEDNTK